MYSSVLFPHYVATRCRAVGATLPCSPSECLLSCVVSPAAGEQVQLLLGNAAFDRALHRYHSKFAYSNAKTLDWIACMEEESGLALQDMAKGWLKRSGHPHVDYSCHYDAATATYRVDLKQKGWKEERPEGASCCHAVVGSPPFDRRVFFAITTVVVLQSACCGTRPASPLPVVSALVVAIVDGASCCNAGEPWFCRYTCRSFCLFNFFQLSLMLSRCRRVN